MINKEPLTFTSEGTTIIFLVKSGLFNNQIKLKYIKDNIQYDYTLGTKITLNDGQSVSFQNKTKFFSQYFDKYYYFYTGGDGELTLSGNIMSLINYSKKIQNQYQFYKLFYNCKNIVSASRLQLPAKKLQEYCYCGMFKDCISLLHPPRLNSVKLENDCYSTMFWGCTQLQYPPDLPAKKLAINCYFAMFFDCKNIKIGPTLPATELVSGCYENMFEGCENLASLDVYFTDWKNQNDTFRWLNKVAKNGMFIKKRKLKEIFGPDYIPHDWLINNIK